MSDKFIYAIIKNDDATLTMKKFPVKGDGIFSDDDLLQEFDYSTNLYGPYTSHISKQTDTQWLISEREIREAALAFKQTTEKILKSEQNIVAISHRKGGWNMFKWKYDEDISFEIYSNFGFGRCSELISRFYYKDVQLTPYYDYIKYRYAGFTQLIRYTYNYQLLYSEWEKLMNDTINFYNAVCFNHENEIFKWIQNHLEKMTDGLNNIISAKQYWFERPNGEKEHVTGDEFEEVKAIKISGSIRFLNNIKFYQNKFIPENIQEKSN